MAEETQGGLRRDPGGNGLESLACPPIGKQELRCPAYLRYVDDLVLPCDRKAKLHQWRAAIDEQAMLLRLRLHRDKAQVMPAGGVVDLLVYRVFPWRRRLRNDNGHRFARRLRRFARGYAAGRLDWPDVDPSVQSSVGHARHADCHGRLRALCGGVVFRRQVESSSSGKWRGVDPRG